MIKPYFEHVNLFSSRVLNILGITLTTLVMVVGMLSVGMIVVCIGKCCRKRRQVQRRDPLTASGFVREAARTHSLGYEKGGNPTNHNSHTKLLHFGINSISEPN
jgi:hypothetical protein